MPAPGSRLQLTTSQAACLEAVKQGLHNKTRIALHTKRDLKTVSAALKSLCSTKLIERYARYSWRPIRQGRSSIIDVIPDPKRGRRGPPRGRIVSGSAADRLLAVLDRPRRGQALVEHLGVTRQRIHQLVVRFHAEGRVRIGDPEKPLHIIARSEDPSILLNRDEERFLSAVPEAASTTANRVRAATAMSPERALAAILALQSKGMLEQGGSNRGQALYQLTVEGQEHFQRRTTARVAEPAPLPVKSDRVQALLSCMAERGEMRIVELGRALGIAQQSMNALMQYLKRKGLVRKMGRDLYAPYVLTDEGKATLTEMTLRNSQ